MRRKIGTALFFGCACAQAHQSLRTMLPSGQSAQVRAHIAQITTGREDRPFRRSRVLQTALSVIGVIKTTHGLATLLDELSGGRASRRSSLCRERCDQATLESRAQACCCSDVRMQRRAGNRAAATRGRTVRAAGFRGDGNLTDATANGLNASGAGMANTLDQVRRWRARPLL